MKKAQEDFKERLKCNSLNEEIILSLLPHERNG